MADTLLDRRLALDKLLRAIVKERCGSENVYYQPKNGLAMNYPCICYERSKIRNSSRLPAQCIHSSITRISSNFQLSPLTAV